MKKKCEEVISVLKSLANSKNVAGMARFGICTDRTLGVSMPTLRNLAKEIGKSHELAVFLWNYGIHEARILASLVDEVEKVTESQMEQWVADFDSWDVCDQVCLNLFWRVDQAHEKAKSWSLREREFERRVGFALMAVLAIKDKTARDKDFEAFFEYITKAATDERNFVKKAVNWALRQIGKRNIRLNKKAIELAEQIKKMDSKSARWIASGVLRELKSEAVLKRLNK